MFHRMTINRADVFHAGKRGNQHQQRRFGQVEIGNQAVGHIEPVARRNENIGIALPRFQTACLPRRRLQRPHGGRTDRPYPAAPRLRRLDCRHGFRRHVEPFAVHFVVGNIADAHGLECPRADVQRYFRRFHAFCFQTA